jgi:nucleoside-diphosphate-sugar epimerase
VEWAQWFWRGAVHIEDVGQAVIQSIDLARTTELEEALVLVVDGAYEYTAADLATWDYAGPGSTFRKYYAPYETLVREHGLVPEVPPYMYDMTETQRWLGYVPTYSLRHLLAEFEAYGPAGPPHPYL